MNFKNKFIALALFSFILIMSLSAISANDMINDTVEMDESANIISVDDTAEELKQANIIYISPQGTGTGSSEADPTNWNDALVKSNSGDTIKLLNGNYTGINNVHKQITKSLTFVGSGNSVIDAQENGGFFTVSYGASVVLENLTLQKAYTGKHYGGPDGTDAPFDGEGGIINNGELTAKNCYFYYNKGFGTEGGSIRNNNICNIHDCVFESNSGKAGASIYCEKNSKLNIYNSEFKKGFSKKGNDIYADENAVVTIRNSTMGNAYGKCGLIVIKKSYLYIYDTYISGSRSIDTAGVINIDKQSTVEIYRCVFEKNTATGGVLLFNEKNETGDGDGGAIVVEKGANNVIIKDSIFKGNTAKNRGGAIYVESDTSITIDNCTFIGNTAGLGDNIYCYRYANRITITNSNFEVKSSIETTDIDYGQNEVVKVSVDDGTYGLLNPTYSLILDGDESYPISANTLTLTNPAAGNHTVALVGNDYNSNRYTFSQPSSIFVVGGENIEVTVSYAINEDGSINVKVVDEYGRNVANKKVNVIINGTDYSATTDSNGVAKLNPGLAEGEYDVNVNVDGKVISNKTASKIVIANKTTPLSDVVDVEFSYSDDGSINVEVKDEYGCVVPDSEVSLTINGETYTGKTDSNGQAVIIPSKTVAGEYDVIISVNGKNVSSTSPTSVKVMPSVSISSIVAGDITRGYNSSYDFKARFLDKNANPLNNKVITFVLNGNDYEVKTDEYGYATFSNALPSGVYNITAVNPATSQSETYKITIVDRISGNKNINMDYSYSATYKVRVFADNGNPVGAGETVVVKIDGKKVKEVKTDADGYATYTVKNNALTVKTHSIAAEYKGAAVSNKLAVKQILKSKNVKVKRSAKTKKFTATLKTTSGKAIKNKKITFKIKGKTYSAKTNKKGVATIKVTQNLKVGKYSVTIKYLKDTIKKTLTVKK